MPYPFTKGVFICGELLRVPENATPAQMEEARERLERTLNEITSRADGFFR